jgi:hypothetical protein
MRKEVTEAKFFAVIVDETTDISNKSQLSTVFRYVRREERRVEERFLRFSDVSSDRTAPALFKCLDEYMDEFKCGDKLVAQIYDGATVMAGERSGLQSLVTGKYNHAMFVHCYAHELNLVLEQSVNHKKHVKYFSKQGYLRFSPCRLRGQPL